MKARVSPIISAEAVAVVRRGLRSEFWPASCPIGPKSFASAAPVARRNGRPITGLAAVTPSSTASTPAPTHHPLCGTAPTNRPITASGMPSAISAIPSSRRRRTDDSGRATSSRSAWTGAIRPVRRAGSQAATIVTMIPVAYAATGVRGARMSGWSARSRPNVATRAPDPHREHETEAEPERRADDADDERLELDRADHLSLGGPQGAQQRQLAAALGDQDREGVDDDVAAHHQRDPGEDQQEGGEEVDAVEQRPGALLGGVVAGHRLVAVGQHRVRPGRSAPPARRRPWR